MTTEPVPDDSPDVTARRKPFTAIRKGIVEHVLTGRLRGARFAVYIWLHLQADHTTGTVWTNAAKLASETGFYPSTVREVLAGLRRDGYLRYESAEGLERFSLAGGQSITTDSRQRVVMANALRGASRPGLVNPEQIVCAEPSPDVAIALANSFGVGISVLGYGSGSLTGAQAEGMAQLAERTVAVQLLRDQMYRACEAYANGAISGTTYSLIMSKNNNAMVTLLLGETAGGAFGRSLAGIGTGSSSGARAALESLMATGGEVKQATEDLRTAEVQVKSAETKLADKQKILAATEAKIDPPATGAQTTVDRQAVQRAQAELDGAQAARDAAAARLKGKADTVAKSSAEVKALTVGGGISRAATPELAEVMKGMQQQFLATDFSEQFVAACLVELGLDPVVGKTEEDFFEKLRTRMNNSLIDEAQNPKDTNLERLSKKALEIYERSTIRFRKSKLSDYCVDKLPTFIDTAHKDAVKLKQAEIALQHQRADTDARARALASLEKALTVCKDMPETAQRTRCVETVLGMMKNP